METNSVDNSAESSEIILSKAQFKAADMKLGEPETMLFTQQINATGYIAASPSGMAEVSSLIPGRVDKIYVNEGSIVKKGQPLFHIESNELIILQQEYADAFYQLMVKEADYKRLKTLAEEKIVTEKDLLKAESEYMSMLARVESLKARLNLIQLDPTEVQKGKIQSGISINAPISGFITHLDLNIGQFIEPQGSIIEIVDINQLQLKLNVFEKDMKNLSVGQTVVYHDPFNKENVFEASITYIGKSIDQDTKTVACIAELKPEDQVAFISNLFVEINVLTCKREVQAISDHALILENGHYYVLLLKEEREDQMIFEKMPIQVGVVQNELAEILETGLTNILVEGVYNLVSEE